MTDGIERDRESGAATSLSVVVVTLAGGAYIPHCLQALDRQEGIGTFEIIVPYDDTLPEIETIRSQFPRVRFVKLDGTQTYAQLRAAGFRAAVGDVIALTEDHCAPDPHWCATILELHAQGHAAVGGSVDKTGSDTLLNWAIYLNDFGRYMNPVREGPAAYLTDCNVSYKRAALQELAPLWQDEFHETTVNWALLDRGAHLWLSPRVIVRQQRSLTFRYAMRERYSFGRLFASTRVAATPVWKRLVYAAFSPILPVIIVGRVVRNVAAKGRAIAKFLLSLPHLVLLAAVWSYGEFVGYVTGTATTPPPRVGHTAGG